MNCLRFPLEIWAIIFEYLSPESLAFLSATCRSLNRTTNADFLWNRICRNYQLEIDLSSISSENFAKERFKLFHLSRKRLLKLDPRESIIKDSHTLGVSFLQESQKGFVSAGWDGQVMFHEQTDHPPTQYRVSKSLQQGTIECVSLKQDNDFIIIGARGCRSLSIHHIPSLLCHLIALDQPAVTVDHSHEFLLAAGPSRLSIYNMITRGLVEQHPILDLIHVAILDRAVFVTVSGMGQISLWALPTSNTRAKLINRYETEPGLVTCIVTRPSKNKTVLLCGFKNGVVRHIILNNQTFHERARLHAPGSDWVSSICMLPKSHLVMVGSWDNKIRMYDVQGKLERSLMVESTPLGIMVNQDESCFIVGRYDGKLATYSFEDTST